LISEYVPEDTWLGPTCTPDFDVNLLAYNGHELYLWPGPRETKQTISDVIEAIQTKQAKQLDPDVSMARIHKMQDRGFTTIAPS
jgi:hypothetical protein